MTGADRDAATVCPTSTLREITTPSMGDTMLVYERFTCARCSCATAWARFALAASMAAWVVATFASAVSEIGLRGEVLVLEGLRAGVGLVGGERARLRGDHACLGLEVVGLGLLDRRLEQLRVDLGDQLALLHLRVEVGHELLDAPGDLGADLDGDERREGSARRDLAHDVALGDRGRLVGHRRGLVSRVPPPERNASADDQQEQGKPDQTFLHVARRGPLYHCRPMENERPLVIVNPRSGGGRAGRTFAEVRAVLERRLGPLDVELTGSSGHAIELARTGVARGVRLVIAVGGDGTLHEVANGVLDAGIPDAAVGYVGQGTGGDFRKTLGLEHRLDAYVEGDRERARAARRRRQAPLPLARGADPDPLVREHPLGGHGGARRPVRVGDQQGAGGQGCVLLGEHTRAGGVQARQASAAP